MTKGDASGWKRGAGTYSRSYPKLANPKLDPRTTRDIYGDVEATSVNDENRGFAGEVRQVGKRDRG